MNFAHYLPNTEGRIERLRLIIDKRPAAIILYGPSVIELEERITGLKDCDMCYCAVNRFWIIEKYILGKINHNLSVVMCSADARGEAYGTMSRVVSFLERPEANMFISTRRAFANAGANELIPRYDNKLLFHKTAWGSGDPLFGQVPNSEYPLHIPLLPSLSVILSLVIIGGASRVAIFGADGGRTKETSLYYRQSELHAVGQESSITYDASEFNQFMPGVLQKLYKTYSLLPVDIINCSPQSHYTPFRKLSYNETFDLLKGDAHA